MNKSEALEKARLYIKNNPYLVRGDLEILEEETITEDFGWVIFYASSMYVKTKDSKYCLGGAAPLIINKYTGEIEPTGTALSIEDYIRIYKKYGTCDPGINTFEL